MSILCTTTAVLLVGCIILSVFAAVSVILRATSQIALPNVSATKLCALVAVCTIYDMHAENVYVSEWGLCKDEVVELSVLELGGQVVRVRRRKWRIGTESYMFEPDSKYWTKMTPEQMCALKQRLIQRHRAAIARRAQGDQLLEIHKRHTEQVKRAYEIERARGGVRW
jgi:hypothetical protein